MRQKIVLSNKK